MNYSTMTTADLIALLATTPKGQTFNAILAEIAHEERQIENTYSDPDLRGGVRPTRRP